MFNRNIFTVVLGILVMFVKYMEKGIFFKNHRHVCLLKVGIVEKFACFMNVDIIGKFLQKLLTSITILSVFFFFSVYLSYLWVLATNKKNQLKTSVENLGNVIVSFTDFFHSLFLPWHISYLNVSIHVNLLFFLYLCIFFTKSWLVLSNNRKGRTTLFTYFGMWKKE